MPHKLTGTGVTKTRSANGQLQVLLPRRLKAKLVAMMRTRKMKSRSGRKQKTSEVQQLETTGTKKYEIVKLSEKRSVQIQSAAAKVVQNDGEATVMCPESSPSHLTLLMLFHP